MKPKERAALVAATAELVAESVAGQLEKGRSVGAVIDAVRVSLEAKLAELRIEPRFEVPSAPEPTVRVDVTPEVRAEVHMPPLPAPIVNLEAVPGSVTVDMAPLVAVVARLEQVVSEVGGKVDRVLQTLRAARTIELRDAEGTVVRRGVSRIGGG